MLWNITENSFYVRRSLSLRPLSFFVTALSFLSHFLLYIDKITFTKFSLSYSCCISTVPSSGPVSTLPTLCSFSYSPIYVHSTCYHMSLHCILCSFNMLSHVSSLHFMFIQHAITCLFIAFSYFCSLSICGKCHVGLSLGDKEVAQPHALLSCELNNRHAVTGLWQILKEVPWWVTHQDGHLLSDCGLKSKQEVCTDAPAQLTRYSNWNLNLVVGDLMLTKPW